MTRGTPDAASHEAVIDSPVGRLRLVATREALTRIDFLGGDAKAIDRAAKLPPMLATTIRELAGYFDGELREFSVRLAPAGTVFQRQVWDALLAIPFGATTTYGEIAHRIGRPTAVRAVGAANGANPIPIIIPCHRVIGGDGSLTGYGGGIPNKQLLLRLEGVSVPGGRDGAQATLFGRK
ncbi:MAG: methylated-DNA--[protein]-cysteine S-methyltransferase [Thermoanaerobaculia bacterium]|jgi:methylated-DNA-[protein]-cysteine S-methyltransferase